MESKRASVVVVVAAWVAAAAVGLFFGWSFNRAYFSALDGTSHRIVKALSLSSTDFAAF